MAKKSSQKRRNKKLQQKAKKRKEKRAQIKAVSISNKQFENQQRRQKLAEEDESLAKARELLNKLEEDKEIKSRQHAKKRRYDDYEMTVSIHGQLKRTYEPIAFAHFAVLTPEFFHYGTKCPEKIEMPKLQNLDKGFFGVLESHLKNITVLLNVMAKRFRDIIASNVKLTAQRKNSALRLLKDIAQSPCLDTESREIAKTTIEFVENDANNDSQDKASKTVSVDSLAESTTELRDGLKFLDSLIFYTYQSKAKEAKIVELYKAVLESPAVHVKSRSAAAAKLNHWDIPHSRAALLEQERKQKKDFSSLLLNLEANLKSEKHKFFAESWPASSQNPMTKAISLTYLCYQESASAEAAQKLWKVWQTLSHEQKSFYLLTIYFPPRNNAYKDFIERIACEEEANDIRRLTIEYLYLCDLKMTPKFLEAMHECFVTEV